MAKLATWWLVHKLAGPEHRVKKKSLDTALSSFMTWVGSSHLARRETPPLITVLRSSEPAINIYGNRFFSTGTNYKKDATSFCFFKVFNLLFQIWRHGR
jgi:hypothetical protein